MSIMKPMLSSTEELLQQSPLRYRSSVWANRCLLYRPISTLEVYLRVVWVLRIRVISPSLVVSRENSIIVYICITKKMKPGNGKSSRNTVIKGRVHLQLTGMNEPCGSLNLTLPKTYLKIGRKSTTSRYIGMSGSIAKRELTLKMGIFYQ